MQRTIYHCLTILITCYIISLQPAKAEVGDCEGLGFVRPADGDMGTIYLVPEPLNGRFPRLGYLPAGTVVSLEAPTSTARLSFRAGHCGFSIDSIIRGHLDRRFVHSLDNSLGELGLNPALVGALITPAHPNVEQPLEIFRDVELTRRSLAASRSQRDFVFSLDSIGHEGHDVMEVRFIRAGSSFIPENLETGFIDVSQDRDLSIEGTFRRQPLNRGSSETPSGEAASLDLRARFNAVVARLIAGGREVFNFTNDLVDEHLLTLAGCKRKGELSLELGAEGEFSGAFLGASVEGGTSLVFSIEDDEAMQFAISGNEASLQLLISALTKCEGRYPFFLQEADIVVRFDQEGIEDINFSIVRSEFYNLLNDEPALQSRLRPESLDRRSRISNIRGDVHPIMVVRRIPETQDQHYWAYFDAIERYLTNSVFDVVDVPRELRFPIILLTMETFSHWRS